jgi:hypothetical protein
MGRLEAAARRLAAEHFEEFAITAGFAQIDEVALAGLLDDDGLEARSEEAVWEALLGWMQEAEGPKLRRELVRKVRFPLMGEDYLLSRVAGTLAAEDADCQWIEGVVTEALRAKTAIAEGRRFAPDQLGPRALLPRAGAGACWEELAAGERVLAGHASAVRAVVECAGRVCSGSEDGEIRVWAAASLAHERTLRDGGAGPAAWPDSTVYSLAAWENLLVSGHGSGELRVWNVATGALVGAVQGHGPGRRVSALAACGPRLVSGSFDRCVKVWAMAGGAAPECERTLAGHAGWVWALAAWGGKAISGSDDRSVRVWDAGTGAHEATLEGHGDTVTGLAVHADRLFSGSFDGTIRVWAAGTWAALRAVEAQGPGEPRYVLHLAMSGPRLVSGRAAFGRARGEVRVWRADSDALECEHALAQPDGADVRTVIAAGGRVWAGVGHTLVVRGRM